MLKILTIVGSDEYLSLPVKPNKCLRAGNIMLDATLPCLEYLPRVCKLAWIN